METLTGNIAVINDHSIELLKRNEWLASVKYFSDPPLSPIWSDGLERVVLQQEFITSLQPQSVQEWGAKQSSHIDC